MKSIEEAAKEYGISEADDFPHYSLRAEMTKSEISEWFSDAFKAGAKFVQRWIDADKHCPPHKEFVYFKLSDGSYANGYSEYYEYGDSCLYIWGKSIGAKHRYENWILNDGLVVVSWRPIEYK